MKAAVLHEVNQPLVIEDVSVPNPGPREVLIRTRVAGLCHSDLHFMEGLYPHPLPAVLGHESAGVVEKVGSDVTYVKPGDPFQLAETATQRKITDHLLGEHSVGMAEVGELLKAA